MNDKNKCLDFDKTLTIFIQHKKNTLFLQINYDYYKINQ